MEITNSPAASLIPVALGEKNTSPVPAVDKITERSANDAQLLARVVSPAEKQSAKQQFESNLSKPKDDKLVKDEPNGSENRAIRAYVDNDQAGEKSYLSDVLGIDVRV